MKSLVCSVTDDVALKQKQINKLRSKGLKVRSFKGLPYSSSELIERISDSQVAVFDLVTKIDQPVIDACPGLELLVASSTGYQNVDVEYANYKGIKVCNCPDVFSASVAEYVFCLILSLVRQVGRAADLARMGVWTWDSYTGTELGGKTVGVIGAGKIGSRVIKLAQGFGMKVLVCTANPGKERAKKLGIKGFSSLEEVMKKSDFVTIHVRLNDKTRGMITAELLNSMKKSAVFINTSPSELVDSKALYSLLVDEKIMAAGLDSFKIHPKDYAKLPPYVLGMMNLPNVIISPDMAWYTKEGLERLANTVVKNIVSYADGRPVNMVVS